MTLEQVSFAYKEDSKFRETVDTNIHFYLSRLQKRQALVVDDDYAFGLLALKKIREHEIREKFFFRTRNNNTTTPFNSHMDLPLMADNAELFTTAENQKQNPLTEDSLRELLSRVTISTLSVQLKSQLSLSGNRHLLELSVIGNAQTEHAFAELLDQDLNIIVDNLSKAQVLHQLLNELIAISDRWVEEHFLFNGFARFSRTQCPERIGEFSLATRQVAHPNSHFSQCYKKMTYQVDFDRKPAYASARSKLGASNVSNWRITLN